MVLCRVEAQRTLNPAHLLNAIAFAVGSVHRVEGEIGILSVRQASWRVPAGASPAQVRRSGRLVVSVAWWKVTTTAKRTQRLCGVGY